MAPQGDPDFKPPAPLTGTLQWKKPLEAAIERQARKLVERQKREQFTATKYARRFRLRTAEEPFPTTPREPGLWSVGPHFQPLYIASAIRNT
jgi:hypothetical protein